MKSQIDIAREALEKLGRLERARAEIDGINLAEPALHALAALQPVADERELGDPIVWAVRRGFVQRENGYSLANGWYIPHQRLKALHAHFEQLYSNIDKYRASLPQQAVIKESLTTAQAVEPVAWLCIYRTGARQIVEAKDAVRLLEETGWAITPLYSAPTLIPAGQGEIINSKDTEMKNIHAYTETGTISSYPGYISINEGAPAENGRHFEVSVREDTGGGFAPAFARIWLSRDELARLAEDINAYLTTPSPQTERDDPLGRAILFSQSARDVALEQAEKACEMLHETISDPAIIGDDRAEAGHNVLNACIKAIRALKKGAAMQKGEDK